MSNRIQAFIRARHLTGLGNAAPRSSRKVVGPFRVLGSGFQHVLQFQKMECTRAHTHFLNNFPEPRHTLISSSPFKGGVQARQVLKGGQRCTA